jgi:hypothetical protein
MVIVQVARMVTTKSATVANKQEEMAMIGSG